MYVQALQLSSGNCNILPQLTEMYKIIAESIMCLFRTMSQVYSQVSVYRIAVYVMTILGLASILILLFHDISFFKDIVAQSVTLQLLDRIDRLVFSMEARSCLAMPVKLFTYVVLEHHH